VRQSDQMKWVPIDFDVYFFIVKIYISLFLNLFLAVTANEDWIWKTQQMNYRVFELKPGQLLGRELCSQVYHQHSRDSLWPGNIDPSIHVFTVIAGDCKTMSWNKWLVGLGVWFSLWVREVPGSNPGRALLKSLSQSETGGSWATGWRGDCHHRSAGPGGWVIKAMDC
jgi:hypothetical protein